VEFGKGKKRFIKHHISGNIDAPFLGVKALETFVHIVVPKEYTLFRPKLKFSCVVGSEIQPHGTPKGVKKAIVWCSSKETLKWC
jgi:hypothetical protein